MRKFLFAIMMLVAAAAFAGHKVAEVGDGTRVEIYPIVCDHPLIRMIIAGAQEEMASAPWFSATVSTKDAGEVAGCWTKYEADGKPAVFLVDEFGGSGYLYLSRFKEVDTSVKKM